MFISSETSGIPDGQPSVEPIGSGASLATNIRRTMPPYLLTYAWQQQFESLRGLLQRSLWLAERSADYDATQILRARLSNLESPALLVVVGEVKAGKSSFINALLREEVCEVAPQPCTNRIQELVYGPARDVTSLGLSWERVSIPKEVLREVTIVDTPGTNSLIQDHQAITERYVPQSDLVFFVFSAVNPHTKSAWELLTVLRKDWHKKIVFVLQQADRASARELSTNREHVLQYARERGVEDPIVFTVSAKLELESSVGSGFEQCRSYLRTAIERGEIWRMKVEGAYETIRSVTTNLVARLHEEKEAIASERAFYQDLLNRVEVREAKANSFKHLIAQRVLNIYDGLVRRSEDEFAERITIGKLLRRTLPLLRDDETSTWVSNLQVRFQGAARKQIASETRQVSETLAEQLQSLMEELIESISRRQQGTRETPPLPQTADGLKSLRELRTKLERVRVSDNLVGASFADPPGYSRAAVAGAGLTLISFLIPFLTQNAWLDLTGVIIGCAGVVMLGAGLIWRRAEMVREFREQLGASREEFQKRLDTEFGQIFSGLFYEVRQALAEPIFRLDLQASHLDA
ncbi:MAG TPA: dynamin family protein, partial [Chthoniobacterales bacterium]|nr:dynamin family protein [Chthoniobacterales bacterium]